VTLEASLAERLAAAMQERRLNASALARKLGQSPDRVTIERILSGQTKRPHRSTLEKLERILEIPAELTGLLPMTAMSGELQRPEHDLTGSWYGHIPKQARRKYETVDSVALTRGRKGELKAHIRRVASSRQPCDVGEAWDGLGVLLGDRFVYIVFYSISDHRPDSNGVLAMRRVSSFRKLDGYYLRLGGDENAVRTAPAFHLALYRDLEAIEVTDVKLPSKL
jgi:transcriptional regulator with XRE-family HTH domain